MSASGVPLWSYDFSRLEAALCDVAALFGPPPERPEDGFPPLRRASLPARTPFPRLSPELRWIALPPVLLSGFVLLHGLMSSPEPDPVGPVRMAAAAAAPPDAPPGPRKGSERLIERSEAPPASPKRPALADPLFAPQPIAPTLERLAPVQLTAAPADELPLRLPDRPAPAAPEAPRVDVAAADPPPLFGTWMPKGGACSRRSAALPMVLGPSGAKAGAVACRFENRRVAANGLSAVAHCAGSGERWRSNVQITLQQNRLTWRSERGSQTYLRCG